MNKPFSNLKAMMDEQAQIKINRRAGMSDTYNTLIDSISELEQAEIKTVKLAEKPIHYLMQGFSPCGIQDVPGEWPKGHLWSSVWADVTCQYCLRARPRADTE